MEDKLQSWLLRCVKSYLSRYIYISDFIIDIGRTSIKRDKNCTTRVRSGNGGTDLCLHFSTSAYIFCNFFNLSVVARKNDIFICKGIHRYTSYIWMFTSEDIDRVTANSEKQYQQDKQDITAHLWEITFENINISRILRLRNIASASH